MKIIFFNTWNGRIKQSIEKFFIDQAHDASVFCLQEVYGQMKSICQEVLPNYSSLFAYKYLDHKDDFPMATYFTNNLHKKQSWILLENKPATGLGIVTQFQIDSRNLNICNFHGVSQPGNKLDTPFRLEQSQTIIDFCKDLNGLKVIGGDFNLGLQTESVNLFEKSGFRNLIKEFNIPTTRNRFVWDKYPQNKQLFSDYVFVSPDTKVNSFSAPDLEISDHLPLILEVEIE